MRSDIAAPLALLELRPEVSAAMTNLMMTLRYMDSSLTVGERELVGAAVSHANQTEFCRNATGAIAAALLGGDTARVAAIAEGGPAAEPDARMRALLEIGVALAKSPQGVTPALVAAARDAGADDDAIHDTVLMASTLCMFNRYFDGIACGGMHTTADYEAMAQGIAAKVQAHQSAAIAV